MVFLKTSFTCVLLACLAQQIRLSDGMSEKTRREFAVDDGGMEPVRARGSDRGMRSAEPRGKFSTKNDMQCVWQSYKERDLVNLRISCQTTEKARARDQAVAAKACEYNGKPMYCTGYTLNPAGFWKQVGRALKKMHDKLCEDRDVLVRTGMCKHAPKVSHFKYGPWVPRRTQRVTTPPASRSLTNTTTTTTTSTNNNNNNNNTNASTPGKHSREPVEETAVNGEACAERVDKQKLGEEYCSGAWSSLCTFLLSMVDSTEC